MASVEAPRGDRTINLAEAAIIRQILEEYAIGKSPKRIAADLNREGIQAPSGGEWGFSTINGNRQRGTGILNNELYIGRLVWNRLRYIKDPATGKRVSRLNPEAEWISQEVPDLRIVDQDLWDRVKARRKTIVTDHSDDTPNRLHERQRGKYLFSGLTRCGCCGGGYSMISSTHIGCSTARNKGTCDNRVNIRRDELEARVLHALRGHLMDPALFKEFCDEFTRQMNRRRMEARAGIDAARSELRRIEREFETLMQALLKGTLPEERIKARSDQLEHRKVQVEGSLAVAEEPPPVLHPSMAIIYRERVSGLYEALQQEAARAAASDVIRSLVSEIILTPSAGELLVDLRGDLAGILAVASSDKQKPGFLSEAGPELLSQVMLVAGTRNGRDRHSLVVEI
jgi:site-specific DNA recombinase